MTRKGRAGVAVLLALGCRGVPPGPVVPEPAVAVRPGLEVLVTDSLHLVRGVRVGLLSHPAGVDHQGRHGVEVLLQAGVRLTALLAAEHGFRNRAAPGEPVATETDPDSGLPIYSLYGPGRAPVEDLLSGVDVILIDLQDVGARYFTWLNTTVEVMRAAAHIGKRVVVLDRPNPIGGTTAGNVLDTAFASGVGRLAMPMRHGLTLGELARLARADLGLGTDLVVVPAVGWRRAVPFDRTGLPLIAPSPNLRDLEGFYHYPGLCLFEATDLSVGRGTDLPFHQIGAPWLDTTEVLRRVRAVGVPGVRFEGVTFIPVAHGDGKYPGTAVRGIRAVLTDPARYDPVAAAVLLLQIIGQVHPDRIAIDPLRFDRLAGGSGLRLALTAGEPWHRIVAAWVPAREGFRERVAGVLLYP